VTTYVSTHSILRLIHILAGIAWVGAAVFVAAFLLPASRTIGSAAAPLLREVNEGRKLHVYMLVMSTATLLSGGVLMWRDAGAIGTAWFESRTGFVFGIGAAISIAAAIVGFGMIGPAGKAIAALNAMLNREGRAPNDVESANLRALQNRQYFASRLGATLLVLSSAAMALARYA
jgi:uncharacterized membrane protein